MLFSVKAINRFLYELPKQHSAQSALAVDSAIDSASSPAFSPGLKSESDGLSQWLAELQTGNRQQRQKAIWQLGLEGDSRAIQPLTQLLLNSDSQHRSLILGALSEIGARTLKPLYNALLICLQDESPEVRKNALRDLTRIFEFSQQANGILAQALTDSDPEVQSVANWAAERMQSNQPRLASNPQASSTTTLPQAAQPEHPTTQPALLQEPQLTAEKPTQTQTSLLEQARQGNVQALAALMNEAWQPSGITVRASLDRGCLQLILEAEPMPPQQVVVQAIQRGIERLGVEFIYSVSIICTAANRTALEQATNGWTQLVEANARPAPAAIC
ncbi:HEAT repeat domain-containing protein [Leptolyngbya sp. FACHB-261]|uniref:HEAT repeat domain-containing protein n=1 Tax=Leptolyngbya sp. FACHB-261 TaxID=2692806 RepID=UPI0016833BA3|nr:HEAT repeat domain-containing protein [Leptolyngbya sp. FACHB-261]MBD2101580.1 hypothetical protein [Leptolyngbya sp. FACHB-261]